METNFKTFNRKVRKGRIAVRANNSTLVSITEKSMENDEAGIKWLIGNTEGWANFLASVKVFVLLFIL